MYRCPESYDLPNNYQLNDFKPFIGEPIEICHNQSELDKMILIEASNTPHGVIQGAGLTLPENNAAPMITVVSVPQTTPTPASVMVATEKTDLQSGSLVDCAGASMIMFDNVPPPRQESMGGSVLKDDKTPTNDSVMVSTE